MPGPAGDGGAGAVRAPLRVRGARGAGGRPLPHMPRPRHRHRPRLRPVARRGGGRGSARRGSWTLRVLARTAASSIYSFEIDNSYGRAQTILGRRDADGSDSWAGVSQPMCRWAPPLDRTAPVPPPSRRRRLDPERTPRAPRGERAQGGSAEMVPRFRPRDCRPGRATSQVARDAVDGCGKPDWLRPLSRRRRCPASSRLFLGDRICRLHASRPGEGAAPLLRPPPPSLPCLAFPRSASLPPLPPSSSPSPSPSSYQIDSRATPASRLITHFCRTSCNRRSDTGRLQRH